MPWLAAFCPVASEILLSSHYRLGLEISKLHYSHFIYFEYEKSHSTFKIKIIERKTTFTPYYEDEM
jgi:hypothetical protein